MVQRGGGGAEHVYLGITISPFSRTRVFFIQHSLHVAYGMVELPSPHWVGSGRDSSGQVASGRVASSQLVASGWVASRQFGSGRVGSGCVKTVRVRSGRVETVRARSRRVGSADFNWKHTANWLEQGKA